MYSTVQYESTFCEAKKSTSSHVIAGKKLLDGATTRVVKYIHYILCTVQYILYDHNTPTILNNFILILPGAKNNSTRTMTLRSKSSVTNSLLLLAMSAVCLPPTGHAFSASSHFHGSIVTERESTMTAAALTMRKQKASDRRTRRMQRGEDAVIEPPTLTRSPMSLAAWQHKTLTKNAEPAPQPGGRGRSRNRSNLYNTLSSYHGNFLSLLTAEYRAEVRFVIFFASCRKKIPVGRFGPVMTLLARIFVWSP
jgi:hypothetical protein